MTIAGTSTGPIEYADEGSGPVVLLLHGTCSNGRERVLHPPIARAGFRVIVPSRPGHGRTPLAVGQEPAGAADAMADLLARLGIGRALVVAVSTGAPTGAALAARHPDLVAGLVLVAATIDRPARLVSDALGLPWTILRCVAALSPRAAAAHLLAATLLTAARRDAGTAEPPDAGEWLRRADLAAVRRALATRPSRVGEGADRAHGVDDAVLAAVRAPTLVVHGRRDAVAPFAGAERARALVPGARLVASAAGGHLTWLGPDAEETTQRIIAFLKECAGPWRQARGRAILAPP